MAETDFYIGQVFEETYPPEAAVWCNSHGDRYITELEKEGDEHRSFMGEEGLHGRLDVLAIHFKSRDPLAQELIDPAEPAKTFGDPDEPIGQPFRAAKRDDEEKETEVKDVT